MTSRRVFTIVGLCALAALASSCTRSDVNVPSPVGPSTFSITFDLEATPNVILATEERPMTTVKATVRKNGAALPNVAVYFKILSGPGGIFRLHRPGRGGHQFDRCGQRRLHRPVQV